MGGRRRCVREILGVSDPRRQATAAKSHLRRGREEHLLRAVAQELRNQRTLEHAANRRDRVTGEIVRQVLEDGRLHPRDTLGIRDEVEFAQRRRDLERPPALPAVLLLVRHKGAARRQSVARRHRRLGRGRPHRHAAHRERPRQRDHAQTERHAQRRAPPASIVLRAVCSPARRRLAGRSVHRTTTRLNDAPQKDVFQPFQDGGGGSVRAKLKN